MFPPNSPNPKISCTPEENGVSTPSPDNHVSQVVASLWILRSRYLYLVFLFRTVEMSWVDTIILIFESLSTLRLFIGTIAFLLPGFTSKLFFYYSILTTSHLAIRLFGAREAAIGALLITARNAEGQRMFFNSYVWCLLSCWKELSDNLSFQFSSSYPKILNWWSLRTGLQVNLKSKLALDAGVKIEVKRCSENSKNWLLCEGN